MGKPYLPCTLRPAIHHSDTPTVRPPILAVVAAARFSVTSRRPHTANGIHSTGARPAYAREVAFTLPIVVTRRAKIAGWRQLPVRRARMTRATIHGSPAHGSRMIEIRAA